MAIKKIDPKAEFKYVSLEDSAIDPEKSDLEQYQKDYNIKHLVFKEGEHPDYFILKNLPAVKYTGLISSYMKFDIQSQGMVMREEANLLNMAFETFSMGCKELENNGQRQSITHEELPMSVVKEISTVITNRAQMTEEEKK